MASFKETHGQIFFSHGSRYYAASDDEHEMTLYFGNRPIEMKLARFGGGIIKMPLSKFLAMAEMVKKALSAERRKVKSARSRKSAKARKR